MFVESTHTNVPEICAEKICGNQRVHPESATPSQYNPFSNCIHQMADFSQAVLSPSSTPDQLRQTAQIALETNASFLAAVGASSMLDQSQFLSTVPSTSAVASVAALTNPSNQYLLVALNFQALQHLSANLHVYFPNVAQYVHAEQILMAHQIAAFHQVSVLQQQLNASLVSSLVQQPQQFQNENEQNMSQWLSPPPSNASNEGVASSPVHIATVDSDEQFRSMSESDDFIGSSNVKSSPPSCHSPFSLEINSILDLLREQYDLSEKEKVTVAALVSMALVDR